MRPFDDIPLEEGDYSDVALMVASVREWPADDFARELDASVARRFAPEPATAARRSARGRLPRWAAGPAVALVAGAVAVAVVISSGGLNSGNNTGNPPVVFRPAHSGPVVNGAYQRHSPASAPRSSGSGAARFGTSNAAGSSGAQALATPSINLTATAPVAPGARQIQSAQISLSTANVHVEQVAQEVFMVVGLEHGTVQSSHITTATSGSGGGYASFSLSVPTGNLQATITELSRLHYAAVISRDDGSQNVSHQYDNDQRQLADAKALRSSLLKQLAAAVTEQQIDSIKAQLKLAEQQISSWQSTLGSLQHRISYSNVSVEVNENGLPILPVRRHHHSTSGFTIARAGHDALHVLVVSAGVALIALAVMIPVGLVAALLMWLWVWLRQRRREHALDSTS